MIIEKEIKTTAREQMIDITRMVQEELSKLNIEEGQALIFVPHTTAGITINENADPDVRKDILKGLSSFNFENMDFQHGEGNSPAHLKTHLTGNSVQLMLSQRRMVLGTWQGIYFCEYDGPRTRKVLIQGFSVK